jgi:hypothetical protein
MRTTLLLAVVALAATAPPTLRAEDNKPPAGFTALFNGKDLEGWQGNLDMKQRATLPKEKQAEILKQRTEAMAKNWTVKDGVIHCDGKGCAARYRFDHCRFERPPGPAVVAAGSAPPW